MGRGWPMNNSLGGLHQQLEASRPRITPTPPIPIPAAGVRVHFLLSLLVGSGEGGAAKRLEETVVRVLLESKGKQLGSLSPQGTQPLKPVLSQKRTAAEPGLPPGLPVTLSWECPLT